MAEYRRFISYIYAYEGDMKTKNVGFAKIEARNGQCRISVSIKGAYESSGKELSLYGYGYLAEDYLLIPIGKIAVRNGMGEAVFGKKEDDLGGSGFGLDFLKGLYLRSQVSARKAYLTTWDDAIIHISSLKKAPEAGKSGKYTDTPLLKAAELTGPITDGQEKGIISGTIEVFDRKEIQDPGEKQEKTEIQVTATETEEVQPEKQPEEPSEMQQEDRETAQSIDSAEETAACEMEVLVEVQNQEEKEAAAASEENLDMENRWNETFRGRMPDEFYYREGFMELPLWDCLRKVLPRKLILAEEGWEVLQIQLQDIGRLPRENWTYGNNSFVLHGYYQYRYLILARRKREKREKFQPEYQYILGVPGIFKPQEKFMASMFGLPDFKKAGNHREDNFGFWCGSIQLR